MDFQITTQPASEPISLAQAKLHLRLDTTEIGTTEDQLLRSYIASARSFCEQYQNRAYIYQTITAKRDDFKAAMQLPRPPLISVDSISYLDNNGDSQTLATSYYDVDTTTQPGKITLAYGQTWPSLRGDHHGVTITYKAGYVSEFTASAGDDTLTANAGVFNVDDVVRVYSTDTLPSGLSADTDYYVLTVSGQAITIATSSGGSTVDITDTGTGTHYLDTVPYRTKLPIMSLVCQMYENRQPVAPVKLEEIPFGVRTMLGIDRIVPV